MLGTRRIFQWLRPFEASREHLPDCCTEKRDNTQHDAGTNFTLQVKRKYFLILPGIEMIFTQLWMNATTSKGCSPSLKGQFGNQRTMTVAGPSGLKTSDHKEKMMMSKKAEQGVPLQAEQADWLEDTDEEIDEQELEAHYSYMAKIQEVSPEESSSLVNTGTSSGDSSLNALSDQTDEL
ncbi:hypothetical protein Tco_0484502 [Tanacetum coccineum]